MKIIITGASRGIGYDTAIQLAVREGHEVLALSRNEVRLGELQQRAEDRNPDARLFIQAFDLVEPDFLRLRKKLNSWGEVDVLINNAGFLVKQPFENLSQEDWRRSFEVNFFGPVRLIHFVLPWLKKAPRAHIVNISSMGGFQGSAKFPGLAAYSASKAALSNLTECLAVELKEENVAVNCLALGAVQTEMLEEAFPGYKPPMTSIMMASFLSDFATAGHDFFNGKVLPVSSSTP
jgi:short-subunit dehydrogenase